MDNGNLHIKREHLLYAGSCLASTKAKFHCFSHLPLNARCLIWEYSLPGPRVVFLQQNLVEDDDEDRMVENVLGDDNIMKRLRLIMEDSIECHEYRSFNTPPPLLFVNREARGVAMRFYALTFGGMTSPARTWFDFNRDTLLLDLGEIWHWKSSLQKLDLGEADWVRNLGIFISKGRRIDGALEADLGSLLGLLEEIFGALQKLYIVDYDEVVDFDDLILTDISDARSLERKLIWSAAGEQWTNELIAAHQQPKIITWLVRKYSNRQTDEDLPVIQRKSLGSYESELNVRETIARRRDIDRKSKFRAWDDKRWSAQGSTASFPQFSNLSPEIRLMIWELHLLCPRTAMLRPGMLKSGVVGHRTNLIPPAALFVCRESAKVMINSHFLVFSSPGCLPETWFDPIQDSLELSCYCYSQLPQRHLSLPSNKRIVRRLIINISKMHILSIPAHYPEGMHLQQFLVDILPKFKSLEYLTIVVPEYAQEHPPWVDLHALHALRIYFQGKRQWKSYLNDWVIPEITEEWSEDVADPNCRCRYVPHLRESREWDWKRFNKVRRYIRHLLHGDQAPPEIEASNRYLHREKHQG